MVKKFENQPECKGTCILAGYPDVLTVDEVSQILRISKKTCLKLLKEGWIICSRPGREYKVFKVKLIEYLNTPYKGNN